MTFDNFITALLVVEGVLVASLVLFFVALAIWGGPFRIANAAQIEADWRRAEEEFAAHVNQVTDTLGREGVADRPAEPGSIPDKPSEVSVQSVTTTESTSEGH